MDVRLDELVFVGLAVWRIAYLLTNERGPAGILDRVKMRAWGPPDPFSEEPPTEWQRLFSCVWCLSFWVTPFIAALWLLSPVAVFLIAVWGAATALDMVARRE